MAKPLRPWLAASAFVLGCGPEAPVPTTPLAELCGSADRVSLLSVGPDDYYLGSKIMPPDRLLVGYATLPSGADYPDDRASRLATTIYSIDRCGEDSRPIATGVDKLYYPEDHGGALLGCDTSAGDVFTLDPSGAAAPARLLSDVGCLIYPSGGGIVGVERTPAEGFGTLTLHPDVTAPTTPTVALLEEIVVASTEPWFNNTVFFAVAAETAFAITLDGELVSIDLSTGQATILRTGVAAMDVSDDGRWVLWQEGTPMPPGPEDASALHLLDRSSGEDVYDDVGRIAASSSNIRADIALIVRADESASLVVLPSLERIDLEGPGWFISHRNPPDGLLLGRRLDDQRRFSLYRMDLATGEPSFLAEVDDIEVHDDEVVLAQAHDEWDYSYWRVSARAGEPELLAEHAYQPAMLSGGRIASVRDIDDSHHGDLWIEDPGTEGATRLDRDVFRLMPGPHPELGRAWPYDDDVVVWSVHDGDRSGLWAARVR